MVPITTHVIPQRFPQLLFVSLTSKPGRWVWPFCFYAVSGWIIKSKRLFFNAWKSYSSLDVWIFSAETFCVYKLKSYLLQTPCCVCSSVQRKLCTDDGNMILNDGNMILLSVLNLQARCLLFYIHVQMIELIISGEDFMMTLLILISQIKYDYYITFFA